MASAPFYDKGMYVCEVVNQAMGESSKGNPQFVLRFKVLGTPDPENPESYFPVDRQYERTHYRVLTEKTIEYFVEDLKALGYDKQSFKYLDPDQPGFHNFVGQTVTMFCSHDTYDGNTSEKWGVARKGGEFAVKPLESKKLRELDNLFGKHLKDLPLPSPAKANPFAEPLPTSQLGADQAITDDDIPF